MSKQQNKIEAYISEWNMLYPYDYLWRKKYGVSFGSKKHLCMNHIDMVLDLTEEVQMRKLMDESDTNELEQYSNYDFNNAVVNKKQILPTKQIVKMSSKEIDEEFANLDLTQFNTKK